MPSNHDMTPSHAPTRKRAGRRWRYAWVLAGAVLVGWAVLLTTVVAPVGQHRELTGREWQRIAADPDAHVDERIVVHGVVTQAGSGTRQDLVRAVVDGLDRLDAAGYETQAELRGADPGLAAGDTFRAEVTVAGSAGEAVALRADRIRVLERRG